MGNADLIVAKVTSQLFADEAFVAVGQKSIEFETRFQEIRNECPDGFGGIRCSWERPHVSRVMIDEDLNVLMAGLLRRLPHDDSVQTHPFQWLEIVLWHHVLARRWLVGNLGLLTSFARLNILFDVFGDAGPPVELGDDSDGFVSAGVTMFIVHSVQQSRSK